MTTITLKLFAWQVTGSVGLLSDALESGVNLVAALVAVAVIRWASSPPDEQHLFGHEKAEYLSAGLEGGLILLAAAHDQPVEIGLGRVNVTKVVGGNSGHAREGGTRSVHAPASW